MPDIVIKMERQRVEAMFEPYRVLIGDDFGGYRNHVYRTITYAMHLLNDSAEHEQMVETAFVYHDVGLWTDRRLDYLESSEALAVADNEEHGWGLEPEALVGAIHWHHKIFRYRGPNQGLIEACRRADWIDATKGWLRKGVSRSDIESVEAAFPNLGFHKGLVRISKDYGGSTLVGAWKAARGIVKL